MNTMRSDRGHPFLLPLAERDIANYRFLSLAYLSLVGLLHPDMWVMVAAP